MMFWTYIVRCADRSYYAGHTDDLESRIAKHQSSEFPGYTRSRRPVTLVWKEAFETRYQALSAERQIKGWSQAKKEALIAGDWTLVSELARNRQNQSRPSTGSGRTES